ncbi:hypothetical protein ACLKA6_012364 [Drosophila palustris]
MSCEWRILLLLQLLVLLMQSLETKGECCSGFKVCADNTWGNPCCGYNRCNIFCCNCRCRVEYPIDYRAKKSKCDDHRHNPGHSHARRMMEHEDSYDRHNRNVNTKSWLTALAYGLRNNLVAAKKGK